LPSLSSFLILRIFQIIILYLSVNTELNENPPQFIEALTRLLVEKGIFSKEEFLNMVGGVDQEMKRKEK